MHLPNQGTIEASGCRSARTFRGVRWDDIEGKQPALKHALLSAYLTDRADVSDHDDLLRIVGDVCLPQAQARDILDSDRYADDLRAVEQTFQRSGIKAVPSIIINQRHLISGGQPVEVFERALREVAASVAE